MYHSITGRLRTDPVNIEWMVNHHERVTKQRGDNVRTVNFPGLVKGFYLARSSYMYLEFIDGD